MSLLVIYLLSSWLPTLIKSSGLSLKDASLITAMFKVGGTIGAIALGNIMDRYSPHRVLGVTYILAGVFCRESPRFDRLTYTPAVLKLLSLSIARSFQDERILKKSPVTTISIAPDL